MMPPIIYRIGVGLLTMGAFYILGFFGCLWVLPAVSANFHDGSIEAAMTGAFVVGPLLALLGFGLGMVIAGRKLRRP